MDVEAYTYNFEVRSMILHFLAAFDGGVVKRYDKERKVKQTINVNYLYAQKQSVLKDLKDKTNHIRLPVVMVSLKGLERDSSRVNDNINGRFLEVQDPAVEYTQSNGLITNIPPAIPVNLSIQVDFWAKFQFDMEQMLTNFIAWFDPYIIVPWKEPMTNQIIRSEVEWDGNVSYTFPERQTSGEQFSRYEASTSFTFKGWVFKNKPVDYGKICVINTDFIITPNSTPYENYSSVLEASAQAPIIDTLVTSGLPEVRQSSTASMMTSSYDDTLRLFGWFPDIQNIYLSGSDNAMFSATEVSAFNMFPDDNTFPAFSGVAIEKFNVSHDHYITFDVPPLLVSGYYDVIISNPCGYSKLSEDYHKIQTNNPYASADPQYQMWIDINEPLKSGIQVVNSNNWAASCVVCTDPS